jgi:hypothetical protein
VPAALETPRRTARSPGGEEGTVIIGELEIIVPLDAGEFGAGQARPDPVPFRPC